MSKPGIRRRRVIDLRRHNSGDSGNSGRNASGTLFPHHKMSLRARRRRLRALLVLVLAAVAGGAVWGISEFSYSPKFAIGEIAVSGNDKVPASLIRAYVGTKLHDGTYSLLSGNNIFLYPRAGIEKSVSEYFPRIRAASISREGLLARAITVAVAERQPFAIWCSGTALSFSTAKDCYLMDDSGFIFARAAASSATSSYLVFGGGLSAGSPPVGQTFLPDYFREMLELNESLRRAGFLPEGAYAENEQDFSIQFKDGFILRALFNADASALVRDLELALSSEPLRGKENKLEYIDLRFGNRLYYKNKD